MKRLLTTCLLLLSLWIGAQNIQETDIDQTIAFDTSVSEEDTSSSDIVSISETFEEAAKRNNIPYRSFEGLEGVEDGYYAIMGVFNKGKNLKRAVKKLKKKGFNAASILNPENNLNYVYLQHFPFGLEAVDAVADQFEGKYKDDVWILNVENGGSIQETLVDKSKNVVADTKSVSVNEVTYDMIDEAGKSNNQTLNISDTPNKSKLVQKADYYFDKMWYAEAAVLYEQALKKGDKNYSYEIIQKAADSYYYNTNMEKAYEWYNILYEQHGKDMSADNVFKYAHSLKGTGKYARSKRLMRLYNKKMKNGETAGLNDEISLPNEVVLDEILNNERDYELKNLAINTEYSDFSPMFLDSTQVVFASAKDSSFLNTRRYKWNDQPYLDLYVSKINKESQDLKDAIKFSKKINTKYHEASVTFSPDNSTMYFTRNNYGKKLKRDKNGVNHLKIYMSKKVGDDWSEAVEVPFNSDDYSTGHPALSPDGKKMYFVSDMPGSIGQTDIFVVDITGPNSFSEPRNLGPEINTERKEMFPFINDKKLYFSSDGHTGLGGLDVYEVAYTEEEGFEDVKNLGQPINSNRDDFSYIINEENQQGFFASNRLEGKGDDDIYSFKHLVIEEVPAASNAIAGVVTELITGEVMPQALVELLDENGIKLKEMITEEDGSFIFEDLEADKKYTIKATNDTYFENIQEITAVENDTVQVDVVMRKLKEMIAVEDGIKKLKTEMIHFDFDRSYIRKDASEELDKLVEVMTEYPNMVIKIESHTDSRGKRAYNKYLSDRRAKSTREYIISRGIAPERIESAVGYGEERLLNECDGSVACTEKQHFLNRRSEFIIVNM
ncbi:cell envelope biogenesis protein OmpA [Maribacter algarum]|uniref:Cell envelope biogenesis protein OmpA n=1 Tax=Maribacter algarum (ex Zhang et al. 2020) TaxID=2578118 RepID=A0A5S3PVC7_9FLAO|nr:OmpA family protein [Maribacter algarum]TMM58966.1 cell envelope biogenesis protein OmpA [Maribacter algarum]